MTWARPRVRRPLGCLALIAIGLTSVALTASSDSAGAQVPSRFQAVASAEALRAVVAFDPPVAEEELANPAALAAQVRLTSLGESTGYASHPYPGEFPATVPGLISSAILDGAFSVPSYPLVAATNHPATSEDSLVIGPLSMVSRSGDNGSSSTVGDGANRSSATASVDRNTGVVTAEAVTELGSIDLGELLRLAGVRGYASVTRAPDGEVTISSDFEVAAIEVQGQQIALTRGGLRLLGGELPFGLGQLPVAPDDSPLGLEELVEPLNALLATLAGSEMSVRFLPSEATESGVVSAGLEIVQVLDTGSPDVPTPTVTVTLGRTAAFVENHALPRPADPGVIPIDDSPVAPSPPGGSGGPVVAAGPVAAAPAPSPAAPTAPPGAVSTQPTGAHASITPELVRAGRFYPVLIVGGLALAGLSGLLRRWGVQPRWTS
jgi:hypothetical protein